MTQETVAPSGPPSASGLEESLTSGTRTQLDVLEPCPLGDGAALLQQQLSDNQVGVQLPLCVCVCEEKK